MNSSHQRQKTNQPTSYWFFSQTQPKKNLTDNLPSREYSLSASPPISLSLHFLASFSLMPRRSRLLLPFSPRDELMRRTSAADQSLSGQPAASPLIFHGSAYGPAIDFRVRREREREKERPFGEWLLFWPGERENLGGKALTVLIMDPRAQAWELLGAIEVV